MNIGHFHADYENHTLELDIHALNLAIETPARLSENGDLIGKI